jgi:hypothetical protein
MVEVIIKKNIFRKNFIFIFLFIFILLLIKKKQNFKKNYALFKGYLDDIKIIK